MICLCNILDVLSVLCKLERVKVAYISNKQPLVA